MASKSLDGVLTKKAHTKEKAPKNGAFHRDFGAADGVRTHDNWNHNPGLYR